MQNSWKFLREASAARVLCSVAESYHLDIDRCLENTHLSKTELLTAGYEIQERQEFQIIYNILNHLSADLPIAIEAGLKHHTTTFGAWGFAVLSSSNVREALNIAIRYLQLGSIFSAVALVDEGDMAHLNLIVDHLPEELQQFLLERDIATIISLQNDILGFQLPFKICLVNAEPIYSNKIKSLTGYDIHYNQPNNRITMLGNLLDTPLRQADDFTFMRYQKECEHVFNRRNSLGDYSKKIREFLLKNSSRMPKIEDLAQDIGVNIRTIQRHLAIEKITFHQLVKNLREDLAEDMLQTTDLTIAEISERLGYAETSVFSRAFKSYKGMPPAKYRKLMKK